MKVSFDFDSTLSTKPMQELCAKFIKLGAEVYVTTTRRSGMNEGLVFKNEDLFLVTDKLGIARKNVTFTQYEDKHRFVKQFDMHFDDDMHEIYHINNYPTKCMGFLYEELQNTDNGIKYY